MAYRDFAQSKALDLVRACAPVDLSHEALPEARDKLRLGERTLLNNTAHSGVDLLSPSAPRKKRRKEEKPAPELEKKAKKRTHVGGLILAFKGVLDGLGDLLLDERVLLARPPVRDLRQARAAKVRVDDGIRAPVGREEHEQVFDAALLEHAGEMVHRRLGDVGTQDRRQDVHREV